MLENLIPMLSKLPPDAISKAGGFMNVVTCVKTCWDIANKLKNGGDMGVVIQEAVRLSKGKLTPEHFGMAVDLIESYGFSSTCEKLSPGIVGILRSISKQKSFGGNMRVHHHVPQINNNSVVSSRLKPLKPNMR